VREEYYDDDILCHFEDLLDRSDPESELDDEVDEEDWAEVEAEDLGDEEIVLTPEMVETMKSLTRVKAIVGAMMAKIDGVNEHFQWSFPADSPDSGAINKRGGFMECSVTEEERDYASAEYHFEVEIDHYMPISDLTVLLKYPDEGAEVKIEQDESLMKPGDMRNISFEEWEKLAIELDDEISSVVVVTVNELMKDIDTADEVDADYKALEDDGNSVSIDEDETGKVIAMIEGQGLMKNRTTNHYEMDTAPLKIDPPTVYDELGPGKKR
jgi:hypothetical protein